MKPVTMLAVCNNKKNKIRSILIIISIFLSTVLLTAISSYGYGIIKYNRVNASNFNGSYYGIYSRVTSEQIYQMKLRGEFTDIGLMATAGNVESKMKSSLYWEDETALQLTNMADQLESGKFPEQGNEICAAIGFFQDLNYKNPKIGDTIRLNLRTGLKSKYQETELKICGFMKENNIAGIQANFTGFISQDFYESLIPKSDRTYDVPFRLDDSVKINASNGETVLTDLAASLQISENRVNTNKGYLMWALDPGMEVIMACAIAILFVVFFSIIVIYNIFQVGLIQKIQEYGKMKAIGATKRQLKQVVFQEGMLLAVIGIPLGILFGYVLSELTFSWLIRKITEQIQSIQANPVSMFSFPILLLSGCIALCTVWLALRKPMKIVSNVSPVEAMRYQGKATWKKSIRIGHQEINVQKMLFANFSFHKRQNLRTVLTMGLSCVLFVIIANTIGNMDAEFNARQTVDYGRFVIKLDYSLNDTAYPENNLDQIMEQNPLDEGTVQKIQTLDGVTSVKTRKILVTSKEDELNAVAVFDREDFELYAKDKNAVGALDYDTASDNNAVFYGFSHFLNQNAYTLNETYGLPLYDGIKNINFSGSLQGAFGNAHQTWVITDDTYQALGLNKNANGYIWIDCDKKDAEMVENGLRSILSGKEHIEILTFQEALKLSNFSVLTMKMMAYSFLGMIGLIGFMNLANTMIIGIITRKQEFGIMQAIGMTNRQLNCMLCTEGILYTAGTIVIALLVGLPIGYAFFQYGSTHAIFGLNIYHIPYAEIAAMILALTCLQILLSFLLSKNFKNESLVERIRYHG